MSSGPSKPRRTAFPSTDWSQVRRAKRGGSCDPIAPLDALLRKYLPALRAHLVRRKRISAEQADDLVQGFVTSKILQADLIGAASPAKGKFRTLLLTSLDRYVVSQQRVRDARKRGSGQVISLDDAENAKALHTRANGADSFEVAWAREVIHQSLARMHELCQARGRPQLWALFDTAILRPALDGSVVPGSRTLMRRFALPSERTVRNQLITARRLFVRILQDVVSEYAGGKADVDEELRALRRAVLCDGAAGGRNRRNYP